MMRRATLTVAVAALVGVCAVSAPMVTAATSATANTQATTTLSGSAAPVTSDRLGVDAVRGSRRQTVQLWMAGHQQAAQQFADAVSTPGSPTYHQYLSPSAYTQRFGPSAAQVRAVHSYLSSAGFTKVQTSINDDYISATAPVSTINQVFSVQMRRYRIRGPRDTSATIESNDRDLTVPTSISSDILVVTGLNSTQPEANDTPTATDTGATAAACSHYWAQKTKAVTPAFRGLTEAAVAVCGYSAKQVRAAYGLTSANTGAGKTIALIEEGAPYRMFQTLTDYAKANGLRAPRSHQYREEAIGRQCSFNPGLPEEQLDSEAVYATAPGADQLMVDGSTCGNGKGDQGLFDAELGPLTGHGSSARAAIESVSFSLGSEAGVAPADRKASHAIALRAAAEGVSLLYASGDAPGVTSPASDPDVTAVGGTTLGLGAHNQRVFETGWSDDLGEQTGDTGPFQDEGVVDGAGGGASDVYREPGYQNGVVPRLLSQNSKGHAGRAVPDISADADFASGMLFGFMAPPRNGKRTPYTTFTGDGTSQSTPLVAGMVADAEHGQRNFGFLNPLLYSLAGRKAYHDVLPVSSSAPQVDRAAYAKFPGYANGSRNPAVSVGVFDTQDTSGADQVTAPGYDTMTGLGTPNGSAFIKGLRSGKKKRP
jgi:subtilase family serine protease